MNIPTFKESRCNDPSSRAFSITIKRRHPRSVTATEVKPTMQIHADFVISKVPVPIDRNSTDKAYHLIVQAYTLHGGTNHCYEKHEYLTPDITDFDSARARAEIIALRYLEDCVQTDMNEMSIAMADIETILRHKITLKRKD